MVGCLLVAWFAVGCASGSGIQVCLPPSPVPPPRAGGGAGLWGDRGAAGEEPVGTEQVGEEQVGESRWGEG